MALTPSTMLPLGTTAPDFALPNTDGKTIKLADYSNSKVLLVMFICNHCPFVKHVAPQLAKIGQDYADKGLGIVAIQSNDIQTHPDDSPQMMAKEKTERGYNFHYLFDADQSVAKAYTAACTPDFFLFDADHKLVYRGQLDDTRPTRIRSGVYDSSNGPTGVDLRNAIDAVLAGRQPTAEQKPSMGCNIKWSAGNEPDYYNL
ncbi:MAG TPA: thioredoxin family protein [Phycisphaerales bacterium]|nr:thioredoxin family protein [Phycisphaerales bacterium]|tara:strand:- start:60 stop:665 length:606 start_codon:yes stop_codon:yes gene_type:complete